MEQATPLKMQKLSSIQRNSRNTSDCTTVMSDLDTYNRARERWEATSGLRSINRRQNLFSSAASSSSSCNPAHDERKMVYPDGLEQQHKPEEMVVSKSTSLLKAAMPERIEEDGSAFSNNMESDEYSSNHLLDGATAADDDCSGTGGIVKGGHSKSADYFTASNTTNSVGSTTTDAASAAVIDPIIIGGIQNIGLGQLEGSRRLKNEATTNPDLTEEGGGGGVDVVEERPNSDDDDGSCNSESDGGLTSEYSNNSSEGNLSDEKEEELFKAIVAFDSVVQENNNPAANKSIGIEEFPLLFEKLGTVYCEEEHQRTFKQLQDENGYVVKDLFLNWYIDWLFGENEEESDSDDEGFSGGENEAVIVSSSHSNDKNCDKKVLCNRLNGFGDAFKLSTGNWKCNSCCVTNSERGLKCIACETPRVGISNSTSSDTTKVDDAELSNTGGGLFGGSNSSNMDSAIMKSGVIGSTGFIFGGGNSSGGRDTASQDASSITSSGFKFGGILHSPKTDIGGGVDAPTVCSKSNGFVFTV